MQPWCFFVLQAALTILKELAAYPHLANGDYADVNREIKKIINKDSNIQVRTKHSTFGLAGRCSN